jgi:ribonuclease BN (tRNA processing enzyme)
VKVRCVVLILALMLLAMAANPQQLESQPSKQHATRTKVVLLGTGTPVPDPDRSGPATVSAVDDRAYLIDFGPGVVRRAEAAALRGVPAVAPGNLNVAFVTHLHSDHTAGYSDLILTGWTSGRTVPLEVYGPSGLQSMTEHILQAYRVDIETRTNPHRPMRDVGRFPDAWKVNAHEIKPGLIYKDDKITVTAFATKHAMESFGYRFDTPDRSIVISGDTNPVEETVEACNGCDVLVHEAPPLELLAKMPDSIQLFVAKYHTRRPNSSRNWPTKPNRNYSWSITQSAFHPGLRLPDFCRPRLVRTPSTLCLKCFRKKSARDTRGNSQSAKISTCTRVS